MMRKKQVLMIVSVAVVSFLIGTLFNINFTVLGGKGKDKDKDLWKAISELESRVETIEEESLPQGFLTAPAYDSGWTSFGTTSSKILWHGLNTTEVLVHIMYVSDQRVWWEYLTDNEIFVKRDTGNLHLEIRVMLWKIAETPT